MSQRAIAIAHTDDDDLDTTDANILMTIATADARVYKQQIASEHPYSLQTISRRVDALTDAGLLSERMDAETAERPVKVYTVSERGWRTMDDIPVCRDCGEILSHWPDRIPVAAYNAHRENSQVTVATPEDLDWIDIKILRLVQDQQVWKSGIADHLPLSVQQTGRRIDALKDSGYLESAIMDPGDQLRRSIIVAYTTTEEGDKVVDTERTAQQEYEVCTWCERVFAPDDHRHDAVPATTYVSGQSMEGEC